MSWTIWALIVLYVVPAVFCLLGALSAARLASDCAKEAFPARFARVVAAYSCGLRA